jgi:superfamily I DNA/RNA helicase
MLAQASAVEDVLAPHGFPASQVVPMLVLAGRTCPEVRLGAVSVVGERDLSRELVRRGARLSSPQVRRLTHVLDGACPPWSGPALAARSSRPKAPAAGQERAPQQPAEAVLFDADEVLAAIIEAACAGPIESWMTWLHPSQASLVSRTWNGPARIRGAAGTGKTVVALHRAKYLAERSSGRVLVTSFVRTLPRVQRSLFDRMAPGLGEQVEFASLHQWAMRLLRERGVTPPVDDPGSRTAFNLAWTRVGRGSGLGELAVSNDYWRDEIVSVIKGRGITDPQEYLALNRIGRRTALQPSARQSVWDLFGEYERIKSERGIWDWADVILQARAAAAEEPIEGYSAVIVDEVQDLSVVGVQLLHGLVGDARNGLLLVGDGQQSIYAGGFTAAEAGVSITGRAAVLKRNYRNGGKILDRALEVVSGSQFDDLSDELESGAREVDIARPGGRITEVMAAEQGSLDAAGLTALADLIEAGVRPGDIAVLCASVREADRWQRMLRLDDQPCVPLVEYDGQPTDRVKVGTYHRSKGLEFAHVFIPDLHATPHPRREGEPEDAHLERTELEQRQLFVAMTRARDGLWLGRVGQ